MCNFRYCNKWRTPPITAHIHTYSKLADVDMNRAMVPCFFLLSNNHNRRLFFSSSTNVITTKQKYLLLSLSHISYQICCCFLLFLCFHFRSLQKVLSEHDVCVCERVYRRVFMEYYIYTCRLILPHVLYFLLIRHFRMLSKFILFTCLFAAYFFCLFRTAGNTQIYMWYDSELFSQCTKLRCFNREKKLNLIR